MQRFLLLNHFGEEFQCSREIFRTNADVFVRDQLEEPGKTRSAKGEREENSSLRVEEDLGMCLDT